MGDDLARDERDGLPLRQIDWAVGGRSYLTFDERLDPDGNLFYLVIFDTGDARLMAHWSRDELESVLRAGLSVIGAAPDGLVLEDPRHQ